jgi:hypothetical protein
MTPAWIVWTAGSGDATPRRPAPRVPGGAGATVHTAAGVPRCARRSLTKLAERELAAGERHGAVALLRAALLGAEPATAAADSDLIAVAALYAATLHPGDDAQGKVRADVCGQTLPWARYAHRSSRQLFGAHHECTIRAAVVLARVLAAHGMDTAAVAVRRQVIAALGRRDGLLAATTIAARVELALARHAAGYCDAAIDGLIRTWRVWGRRHGPGDRAAIAMLLHLSALLDACGEHDDASRITRLAFTSYATPAGPTDRRVALPPVAWTGADPGDQHAGLCQRSTIWASGRPRRRSLQLAGLPGRRQQP